MDFNRLQALSLEIDIINAIINNNKDISFNKLFESDENITEEFKLNKLCELAYKVLKQVEIEEEDALLEMFNEIFPDNSAVGRFCIDFIKINLEMDNMDRDKINERIELLLKLDGSIIPDSQIKIDYYNLILTLLLNQDPINLNLINKYNIELKALLNK